MEGSRTLSILVEALSKLTELRDSAGNWIDFEIERPDLESQVYKRLDAISCYVVAMKHSQVWDRIATYVDQWLETDIQGIFDIVKEDGFYPSPYAQVRDKSDQYTDFACDLVHLCCDIASTSLSDKFSEVAADTAKKAVSFLTAEGNQYRDPEEGYGWAPNATWQEKPDTQDTHNSYFTSLVAIALHRASTHKDLSNWLGKRLVHTAEEHSKAACRYLLACIDNGIVISSPGSPTGAVDMAPYEKLMFTCWGLRGLLECRDLLTRKDEKEKRVRDLAQGFLALLEHPLASRTLNHPARSSTGLSTYYEHRTNLGGIISCLAAIKRTDFLKDTVEQHGFRERVDSVHRQILDMQDEEDGIWYKDDIAISAMPTIILDLFLFMRHFRELDQEVIFRASDLKAVVEQALKSANIVSIIAQSVAEGLSRIAEHRQVEAIKSRLEDISEPKRKKKEAKRRRARKR